VTAEENQLEPEVVGRIPIDASFSPVRRVRYRTEDTRVGQRTNYDRLILEIWTDGTLTPEMALIEASKILRKHLDPFVQYFDLGHELQLGQALEEESGAAGSLAQPSVALDMNVADLDIPARAKNCLAAENVQTLADLIAMTEDDLMALKNFGRASLDEVKNELHKRGLSLGMKL
jgi:DNA-directed RNA polymerase subunit alpha